MIRIVTTDASATNRLRCVCRPSARNASSGPYADEDSPSAPSPTHAKNAMSERVWKTE